MTIGVKHWLPRGAYTDDAVKAALCEPVARWSGRWFGRETAAVATVLHWPETAPPQARVFSGSVAEAQMSGPGKRRVLEAALDVDLAAQALGEGDRRVLDGLAQRIAEDLVAVLDETFGGNAGHGDDARIGAMLSLRGGDALAVTLPSQVLVPALKARLGAVRKPTSAPRERVQALGPLRVMACGVLGSADLSVSDVDALGIGDVVILDRTLSEPVELRIAESGNRIGKGKLSRNGGRVAIQF